MTQQPSILLIQDNEDIVFLLQHAIKKSGISNPVQILVNGEDAIAYLAGTERFSDWNKFPLPSLVLLDVKLPGASGFDVLKWIRQHPGLKNLRVAILTSSDSGKEIATAYGLGANVFLTIPVDLDKLVEMMKALLAHWLLHAQAPELFRSL